MHMKKSLGRPAVNLGELSAGLDTHFGNDQRSRLRQLFRKPFRWAVVYTLILVVLVSFVLLDTFVIPRPGIPVNAAAATTEAMAATDPAAAAAAGESMASDTESTASASESAASSAAGAAAAAVITANSYQDGNIQITIETVYKYDTTIYIADIRISSIDYLKTAFAKNTYGRNIKETTSTLAQNNNALLAINGDYYGFRDYGFVLRNGVLYRDTAREAGDDEALLIDRSGNFSVVNESRTDAQTLADAWQVLSFGPALVNNGQITVDAGSEVSKSMSSNPRTAIGQISALHYLVIVSDGRTSESAGLSLLELAQEFAGRGCTVAYNLDGGGSTTLWFNGQVVNNPTDGRSIAERSVSDIVYIGF